MDELNRLCNDIKENMLDSAPDIWRRLKKSAAKYIAEQLIKDLDGIPSNYGKLINEQINEVTFLRKVA